MITSLILFKLQDKITGQLSDIEQSREFFRNNVELFKTVPGLKEKYYINDPRTSARGAFLLWESKDAFEAYLKSDIWKEEVLDNCIGYPDIELYELDAILTQGVLI